MCTKSSLSNRVFPKTPISNHTNTQPLERSIPKRLIQKHKSNQLKTLAHFESTHKNLSKRTVNHSFVMQLKNYFHKNVLNKKKMSKKTKNANRKSKLLTSDGFYCKLMVLTLLSMDKNGYNPLEAACTRLACMRLESEKYFSIFSSEEILLQKIVCVCVCVS